jgi:hypothetical protein
MAIIWKETFGSKLAVSLHYRARTFAPYEAWLRHGHRRARAACRRLLPEHSKLDDLCQELRARGVAQRHLGYFGAPYEEMVAAADKLCAELAAQPVEGEHFRDVQNDERLLAEPSPFLFLLSEPLLDLAERYMGLPVRYFGLAVKREIANGEVKGTRGFHTDPEDENVLKLIVYLNDVDAGTGPFQCISAPDSAKVGRARGAELERIVPPSSWVTCLGPRLTANVCDTARCLHRASPPITRDRYSITFSYVSERPYLVWGRDLARQERFRERWGSLLNARQMMALERTSGRTRIGFSRPRSAAGAPDA